MSDTLHTAKPAPIELKLIRHYTLSKMALQSNQNDQKQKHPPTN
jgi:hypothetical protein